MTEAGGPKAIWAMPIYIESTHFKKGLPLDIQSKLGHLVFFGVVDNDEDDSAFGVLKKREV